MELFHYTDKNGHDAIIRTMKLLPSTEEGKAHTHYGKGVYFGTIDPHFDAQFMGLEEVAATLFNRVSRANFEKFFYYVCVDVPPGFEPQPEPVLVTDDSAAGFSYENKYLYLMETLSAVHLSPGGAKGTLRLVRHGLTYWGQLREMGLTGTAAQTKEEFDAFKSLDPGWRRPGSF